ncbi:hypothetical protein EsHS_00002622 [Epichloe bromicola]
MELPRESMFLPTIKCSICGNQVEISMMGDHLCSDPSAELSPPPEAGEAFESQFSKPPYSKYSRTPPPPIDTGAAGTSYMHRGQMTPVSQPSQSPHASPGYPERERERSSRDTEDRYRSRNDSENIWEAPKSAVLPKSPGGYGGFNDITRDIPKNHHAEENSVDSKNSTSPGPFDSARRPSTARNAYPQRKESLDRWTPPSNEPIPPRRPKKDGYEGFGAPNSINPSSQASLNRSETYPKPYSSTESSQTHRTTSAAGPRPDRSHITIGLGNERKRSMGPDTSRKPPPRTSLLPEKKYRNTGGSVNLAVEFGVGNPYHSSTSSASSGYSNFSIGSHETAQTSPTRSQTHRSDLYQTMEDTKSTSGRTRPSDLRIDAAAASSHQFVSPTIESPYGVSPKDTRFDRPSIDSQRAPHGRGGYSSSPPQDGSHVSGDRRYDPSTAYRNLPSPRRQDTWERQGSRGHLPLPSRGDCKACGVAITGKSITSADGRLTGKYHKACFVCTTCSESFSSSVFYVLGDKPYCEQHYHKLNGSLCGSCGRGIEGRFAEDEAKVKYHVSCFRCLDCGLSLADGYFEVGGYAYCERDAWKRVQAQSYAEQETHQPGPPRAAVGARIPNGLPTRPSPHSGRSGRPHPPPPNGVPKGGRPAAGPEQRLRMNKRMTRLGRLNA